MDSHFLTDIDIIDFKCFQNFSAKGFKRVNLIGGKNNIGKTAFMEACYINVHAIDIDRMMSALFYIKYAREAVNLVGKEVDRLSIFLNTTRKYISKSNIGYKSIFLLEKDGVREYEFTINDEVKTANFNNLNIVFSRYINNVIFIGSLGLNNNNFIERYQVIQKQDKEDELSDFIQKFDSSITNFKVIGEKPLCKVDNQYRDLSEFGDGLRHYISIICALYACENGCLFIDEIDNGIYYDQLDRLWEIILTISKETNCQVFATTHSKEMIESFARVSQKLNEQDVSYTTLVKNDKNEVKALVQDYEMFMYSMNSEHEVR